MASRFWHPYDSEDEMDGNLAASKWLTEGRLEADISDKLAIVMVPVVLSDLDDWVPKFVAPGCFYKAQEVNPKLSKWKNGFVGSEKRHISVQTGLYPAGYANRPAFYSAMADICSQIGPIDDMKITQAVAWPPPPGCIANGDLDYRCVALIVEPTANPSKMSQLRALIRENVDGHDVFGEKGTFHITVAYIYSPDGDTQQEADHLVAELERRYVGQPAVCGPPHIDDNGFEHYGSSIPISDWLV
jgi:hypothetical protein